MKFYKITDLEQLTGIKAHTIRIWEKRYNLIEPARTDTNIRRYDDAQVKKLLNVSTLLSQGYKISKIAQLKDKEINATILGLQQGHGEDVINKTFVNDLASAMLEFNETAFEKTFSAAVNRLGLYEAMLQVFYPLLYKIGVMWASDTAMPVQEHFASAIIKRKLSAAIDGLPTPAKRKKKFLLCLPPNEYHEIALLFSNYIIKAKGYETIYLGPNVPYENINEVLKYIKPNYLITFFIAGQNEKDLKEVIKHNISLSQKELTVLIGGSAENLKKIKIQKNTQLLHTPADLLNFL